MIDNWCLIKIDGGHLMDFLAALDVNEKRYEENWYCEDIYPGITQNWPGANLDSEGFIVNSDEKKLTHNKIVL